jgi:hypothetical protein
VARFIDYGFGGLWPPRKFGDGLDAADLENLDPEAVDWTPDWLDHLRGDRLPALMRTSSYSARGAIVPRTSRQASRRRNAGMTGGDPDAQRARPDHERERRVQFDRFAVDAGMHGCCRVHREMRRTPDPGRRIRPEARAVEHEDAEFAAVEPRPRSGRDGAVECVGVVRHEHYGRVTMLVAEVVDEAQFRSGPTRTEHLRGRLQKCPHLRFAVGGLLDRVAVNAERDVVEKDAAVHLRHIDRPLDSVVAERIQRADEVMSIDTEIERKVIAGAGGNADERKPLGPCGRGHDRERPVATGHAERIRPLRDGFTDERCHVLLRLEDAGVNAALHAPDRPALPALPCRRRTAG